MGQTPNPKPQPPKSAPRPPRGDGEGAPGEGDEPIDFCLMPHRVTVVLEAGTESEIGDRVSLGLGSPPTVLSGGSRVGVLSDSIASALTQCLTDGYRLNGRIESIDLERRRAQVRITGERSGD